MKIKILCSSCQKELNEKEKFCPYCGGKATEIKEEIKSPKNDYKGNTALTITLSILGTFIVCLILAILVFKFYLKDQEITKINKDVTVVDNGIADAVEKVYDATVVIESYYNDRLISTGTGFIFKKDDDKGYILTNYHVIDGSTKIKIIMTNNKDVEATLVNGDEYADIAVLSIDASDVTAVAELGSSEDMRVGDTTFAVGAPIDSEAYSWSVTRGILSGKNRVIKVVNNYNQVTSVMEVLQTDTAINSGNSGGPLCNANGEVIGITNMKLASSTIEGIGFAIPIEKALEYANTFVSGENIDRPYLGVSMYDTLKGIYIQSVEENSPAEAAGLKAGDRIIKIDEVETENTSYLKYQLYKYKVGDKIKVTYIRDETEQVTDVTLGSYNTTT